MIKFRAEFREKRGPTSIIKIGDEHYVGMEKYGSIGRKGT